MRIKTIDLILQIGVALAQANGVDRVERAQHFAR